MGVNTFAVQSIETELEDKRRLREQLRLRQEEISQQIRGISGELSVLEEMLIAASTGNHPTDLRPRD